MYFLATIIELFGDPDDSSFDNRPKNKNNITESTSTEKEDRREINIDNKIDPLQGLHDKKVYRDSFESPPNKNTSFKSFIDSLKKTIAGMQVASLILFGALSSGLTASITGVNPDRIRVLHDKMQYVTSTLSKSVDALDETSAGQFNRKLIKRENHRIDEPKKGSVNIPSVMHTESIPPGLEILLKEFFEDPEQVRLLVKKLKYIISHEMTNDIINIWTSCNRKINLYFVFIINIW